MVMGSRRQSEQPEVTQLLMVMSGCLLLASYIVIDIRSALALRLDSNPADVIQPRIGLNLRHRRSKVRKQPRGAWAGDLPAEVGHHDAWKHPDEGQLRVVGRGLPVDPWLAPLVHTS